MADPVNGYCTEGGLADRLSEAALATRSTDALADIITSASREIDSFCGRVFYQADTNDAPYLIDNVTDRHAPLPYDFYSITSVKVDANDDSTWSTTLTVNTDYLTEPLNAVSNGISGWPIEGLRALRRPYCFQPLVRYHAAPALKITGKRGWSAIPAPVTQACLLIATETFKLREAPFGVAGFGEFGAVRIRENPVVARMLEPYQRLNVVLA